MVEWRRGGLILYATVFVMRLKVKDKLLLRKFINLLLECYMLSSGSKCLFKQTHFFTNRNKKWRNALAGLGEAAKFI